MACYWNYQTGDRRGRPVILLNVDCKIATKAIARRIEPLLPNLVHTDQTGFIKGRYIGENIRLIIDIMERKVYLAF